MKNTWQTRSRMLLVLWLLSRRADQLIAFRVVRKDEDDGVTIIWKKIKEYPKPGWTSNHDAKH